MSEDKKQFVAEYRGPSGHYWVRGTRERIEKTIRGYHPTTKIKEWVFTEIDSEEKEQT